MLLQEFAHRNNLLVDSQIGEANDANMRLSPDEHKLAEILVLRDEDSFLHSGKIQ